jgi:hypothetical protein
MAGQSIDTIKKSCVPLHQYWVVARRRFRCSYQIARGSNSCFREGDACNL